MKNLYTFLICMLCMVATNLTMVQETREMIIEPMQALNQIRDFVQADLAATDSATVAATKYIGRRGAT